jgi:hypothetical protein
MSMTPIPTLFVFSCSNALTCSWSIVDFSLPVFVFDEVGRPTGFGRGCPRAQQVGIQRNHHTRHLVRSMLSVVCAIAILCICFFCVLVLMIYLYDAGQFTIQLFDPLWLHLIKIRWLVTQVLSFVVPMLLCFSSITEKWFNSKLGYFSNSNNLMYPYFIVSDVLWYKLGIEGEANVCYVFHALQIGE